MRQMYTFLLKIPLSVDTRLERLMNDNFLYPCWQYKVHLRQPATSELKKPRILGFSENCLLWI